ncbi:phage major capsid protein [Tritonibacter litoralis]|nr:phage major capsid protein [Tritonibacter litoralis]
MSLKIPAFAHRMGEITGAPDGAPSDSREVEISFSSETPYKRYNFEREESFLEVLGHGESEVDLTRLNSGAAPLLKDHKPVLDAKIGVVVRAWLEGARGKALVRFSKSPAAEDVLARVRDGDITCVSVGYAITHAERMPEQDGHPVVRVTRWVPKEISFVAIPADPTVGYGRADQNAAATIIITEKEAEMPNTATTETRDDNQTPATPAVAAAPDAPQQRSEPGVADALTAERRRSSEIIAIGERFNMATETVRNALDKGTSVGSFREIVMDQITETNTAERNASQNHIGLNQQEIRDFSLMNLVRYMANPSDANERAAGMEIEAARTAANEKGANTEFTLPTDILFDRSFATRAQNVGTPAAGGNLVATNLMAGSFIDTLKDAMPLAGAGAVVLPGLVGDVDIPKQTGDVTEYWLGEDEDGTDSEITVGTVSLSPHTVGFGTPITRKMMKQGTPGIETLVRNSIIYTAARAIERAAVPGHASPNAPTSVRSQIVASATDWSTTDEITRRELVGMKTAVKSANAMGSNPKWLMNSVSYGGLEEQLDGNGNPLFFRNTDKLLQYGVNESNVLADFEVFFGVWSNLVIGMWSGLDLSIDKAAKAASGGIVLRAFQDVDFALRHIESFKMGKNA